MPFVYHVRDDAVIAVRVRAPLLWACVFVCACKCMQLENRHVSNYKMMKTAVVLPFATEETINFDY